jgi:hypothetical protein
MNFVKKLFGLDKIQANIEEAKLALEKANQLKEEAEKNLQEIAQEQELAKLTPKERATRKKEPWVGVLNTHINKENVRNGFFELDWNEYFIVQLKQSGYGFDGDPDEQIVDRWFKELCQNVLAEEGIDADRNFGYINSDVINKSRTQ